LHKLKEGPIIERKKKAEIKNFFSFDVFIWNTHYLFKFKIKKDSVEYYLILITEILYIHSESKENVPPIRSKSCIRERF